MAEIYSIGVDIGTSTTEIILSKLTIQSSLGPSLLPVTSIEEKEVVYRSPIYFTPITEEMWIDFEIIKGYVEQAFVDCQIRKEEISTGAVIITGEPARKENAASVTKELSAYLGSFVVATAGPKLEALLAGYGAKAQEVSKEKNCRILNLDIGGGTANNVLFDCGEAVMTYALDIGGRLLRVNEKSQVVYLSERIAPILQEENLTIELWEQVKEEEVRSICRRLATSVLECAGLLPMTETTKKLYITEYMIPEQIDLLSVSGGVGEYIDKKEVSNYFLHGDMGILLGEEIREALKPYKELLYIPKEKIRATVIGAGAHSLSVSGSTIGFDAGLLPMKNVPIIKVFSGEEDYTKIYERAKERMELYLEENIAIGFRGERSPSYKNLCLMADQIIRLYENKKSPILVLLEEDFAKALSQVIRRIARPDTKIICLDKIVTINGDYIDIGEPIMSAIPVVIKTLIYQS